jgi:hypothetical protein
MLRFFAETSIMKHILKGAIIAIVLFFLLNSLA